MIVLGIETSCDETAASIVKDGCSVLSNVISSSEKLHREFGGVVPEIAFRHHVEKINLVIDQALKDASIKLEGIDLIAVTKGPGLVGSLLTGVTAAKWMRFILDKPVIGINHVQGHLFSPLLKKKESLFPALGLVVSGGHTLLAYIKDYLNFDLIATTLDDAAGEAFDKVAKLLNLGYPGGPLIEKISFGADYEKVKFPIALKKELNFSFSGLKTAVLYYIRDNINLEDRQGNIKPDRKIADLCASFQETVVETLVSKTQKALEKFKEVKFLFTGGGVVANSRLRQKLSLLGQEYKINVLFPDKSYCTDNAAMIAGLGFWQYLMLRKKKIESFDIMDFEAIPDLNFETV